MTELVRGSRALVLLVLALSICLAHAQWSKGTYWSLKSSDYIFWLRTQC